MEMEPFSLEAGESVKVLPNDGDLSNGMAERNDAEDRVDFVLVWEESSSSSSSSDPEESVKRDKRATFEENLRNEGLVLEQEQPDGSRLHFVKVRAPVDVLKRYAEILKLRLPMKKFDHIKEIRVASFEIPLFSDVVHEMQSWVNTLRRPFMWNQDEIPPRRYEMTATFSRDKEYLFDFDKPDFFTQSDRSRIIEFILKRKRISNDVNDDFAFGIKKCLNEGIYTAAYPLHDGSVGTPGSNRAILHREWASFKNVFKFQPLDAVRDYYGVKIALYFAWLGFYSNMLILPAIAGFAICVYGAFTTGNDIPSQEICENSKDIFMCPACDHFCKYWSLSKVCAQSKVRYIFDNFFTVFFAGFMSFWATLFIELWKRQSSEIAHRWDVTNFSPEEEHPRPEYLEKLKNVEEKTINFVTQTSEPKVPFWTRRFPGVIVSTSMVLLMVFLVLAAVFGVILYRMSMIVALSLASDKTIKSNAALLISATGATINLLFILIINQLYHYVAVWLTQLELNRTQTQFEDSLSLKIYVLQFVNYYSSIFYVAFIKGKFVGYPAKYNRILGYRQEECAPGGCFMEVCLQMAIIFMGKQFIMSLIEYQLPRLWKLFNKSKVKSVDDSEDPGSLQWVRDYKLVEWGQDGLFNEYLEMVIQYGFITIFVTAFPLAPFFALINNILELRLDAKKLLVHHRRVVAHSVNNIGIWLGILETVTRIAVLTNGFLIAFTSDFIPRMVYVYHYSSDGSLNGYLNFTLSSFNPDDLETTSTEIEDRPERCSYYDFRQPPEAGDGKAYTTSPAYWHVLTARLAFVVVFQNVVSLAVMMVKWIVRDTPKELEDRIKREAYLTNELVIKMELLKATGKIDENGEIVDGGSLRRRKGGEGKEARTRRLLQKLLQLPQDETGDVTDGNIIV